MQQRRQNGVGVQADLHNDLRHGQRVNDIRLAALAKLLFMLGVGKAEGLVHQLQIRRRGVAGDGTH